MVAPIRELANTLFSTSFTTLQSNPMAQLPSNMDMDVNIDIIRGRSASSSQISFGESLTHSAALSTPYHKRMKIQNNLLNKDKQEPVESFELSYASGNEQKGKIVRQAIDNSPQEGTQCVHNETPALNSTPNPQGTGITDNNNDTCHLQEVFDIQLPYDIN